VVHAAAPTAQAGTRRGLTSTPTTILCDGAVRAGMCGTVVVAASMITAVATGYGVATADISHTGTATSGASQTESTPAGPVGTKTSPAGAEGDATADDTGVASPQSGSREADPEEPASDDRPGTGADTEPTTPDPRDDRADVDDLPSDSDTASPDEPGGNVPDTSRAVGRGTSDGPPNATHDELPGDPEPEASPVESVTDIDRHLSEFADSLTAGRPAENAAGSVPPSSGGSVTVPVYRASKPDSEPDAAPGRAIAAVAAMAVVSPFLDTGPSGKTVESPFLSALLAWVRRTFFNKSPSFAYDPAANVQGPYGVITGNVGAVDPEGDAIAYSVVRGPEHGTVVIDQATGHFTYTPDLDYAQAGGTDTFVVRVTDNVWSLRDLFSWDHGSPKAPIAVSVESILPSAQRFIVPLPNELVQPQNAVFTANGTALVFRATPQGALRSEIYRVNPDGTGLQCLSCGLAPEVTVNLSKPFVFDDGNRILLSAGTQSDSGGETADHYILECAGGVSACSGGSALLKINVPTAVAPGVTVVQKERELRVAPDGVHVAFTQLLSAGTATQLISAVGVLVRTDTGYDIVDARVVYVGGELKNFTPDGKGVMVTDFSGRYEAGNADDVLIDLRTGEVSRLTASLDYDESVDMSPNGQWLAVGSSRTRNYLTPMSQIVRPTFVPAYVVFPTFQAKKGTLNQAWVVSRDGELSGDDGIFLGDPTGAYISVPVANWSPDGDQIAFWERSAADPLDTRLVIAQLKNIDGGAPPDDVTTPDISGWAPSLSTVVPKQTPLEPSRDGRVSGHATVVTTKVGNITTTTVTYTNFSDESGLILNGSETTTNNPAYTNITYTADISVTGTDGADRGYLRASNVKIVNQLSMTGTIESSLDGNHLVMGTPG